MTDEKVVEEVETELVDINDADIESLNTALTSAIEYESTAEGLEVDQTVTPSIAQKTATTESDGQKVAPTEAASSITPEQRTYTQEEIQDIVAQNERQKKQIDQKELFIQQRSTELGTVRQQLAAQRQQLAAYRSQLVNGLEDRFSENPLQASNDRDTIKQIDQRLVGINQQEQRAATIVESQTFFLRHVDTEKVGLDDLAATLKADGVDDRYIAQFKANPWEWTTPEALVQLGKRAEDRKAFEQADSDRRILAQHITYLNSQAQKLKAKPGQIMSRVQQGLNQTPQLTAASSGSARVVSDLDVDKMSRAELDAALKEAMAN
jgi:hypothetical protein